MAPPARRDDGHDAGAVDDLIAIMRTLATGALAVGGAGLTALAGGTETALSAFVRGRVVRAIGRAEHAPPRSLHDALAPPTGSGITGRIGRSGAARLARRAGPIARRSPTALALRFGPAVYDVGTTTVREIDAVAHALAARTFEDRREPDVDRVHAATVQVLGGGDIDPAADPDHAALARRWAKRIGTQLVPFGLADRRPDVDALTRLIESVDPATLGTARRRRRSS